MADPLFNPFEALADLLEGKDFDHASRTTETPTERSGGDSAPESKPRSAGPKLTDTIKPRSGPKPARATESAPEAEDATGSGDGSGG